MNAALDTMRRRFADIALRDRARALMRDRSIPFRERVAAFAVWVAFSWRVRFNRHGDPGRTLRLPVYGRYCGPGYGDADGSDPAQGRLDSACRLHDLTYADARGDV